MTNQIVKIEVPAGSNLPALSIDLTATTEAEKQLVLAKTVSPSNYTDLEHTFGESYRELGKALSSLEWQIDKLKTETAKIKSRAMMGDDDGKGGYFEFMSNKPKGMDSQDMREAFLMKNAEYLAALDRMAQLSALSGYTERRIKVMENVCRYMKKKMDLIIRSGVPWNPTTGNGQKR